jgi:hypothetical protein
MITVTCSDSIFANMVITSCQRSCRNDSEARRRFRFRFLATMTVSESDIKGHWHGLQVIAETLIAILGKFVCH